MRRFTTPPTIPHLRLLTFGVIHASPVLHGQHSCYLRSLQCVALTCCIDRLRPPPKDIGAAQHRRPNDRRTPQDSMKRMLRNKSASLLRIPLLFLFRRLLFFHRFGRLFLFGLLRVHTLAHCHFLGLVIVIVCRAVPWTSHPLVAGACAQMASHEQIASGSKSVTLGKGIFARSQLRF